MEHVVGSEGGDYSSDDDGIGDDGDRGGTVVAATIGFRLFTFQFVCVDSFFPYSIDLRGSAKDEVQLRCVPSVVFNLPLLLHDGPSGHEY